MAPQLNRCTTLLPWWSQQNSITLAYLCKDLLPKTIQREWTTTRIVPYRKLRRRISIPSRKVLAKSLFCCHWRDKIIQTSKSEDLQSRVNKYVPNEFQLTAPDDLWWTYKKTALLNTCSSARRKSNYIVTDSYVSKDSGWMFPHLQVSLIEQKDSQGVSIFDIVTPSSCLVFVILSSLISTTLTQLIPSFIIADKKMHKFNNRPLNLKARSVFISLLVHHASL